MIDAILTGMTGRISTLHKVQPERPYKSEKAERSEQKAPASLDNVSLSKEAIELYRTDTVKKSEQSGGKENGQSELSEDEKQEVKDLKERDTEVRRHEQAHQSAGAPYTSAPKYEYTTGPDDKRYATGGSVDVDTSEESTPEKTIEKAQVIKRSASAPAEPSSQDRNVAVEASRMEREARAELAQQKREGSANGATLYGMAQYAKSSAPSVGSMVNFSS